ncbi:type II toxin-antitoxin system RelE/ParE family toxin [Candidatus Magnetomonas plexicatena]|uniref:type II toxin-antitoxin system RelE/ParE family toxin n=1 Tax=Candidatus Magnetomonas plexicatena TaxID=2552947 RepID=UPI00110120BE|nr:type II toxin-antitoxin system mRNA interferase toxin, RelE/StbE family [Nitrospirales bacterium LBB_01]
MQYLTKRELQYPPAFSRKVLKITGKNPNLKEPIKKIFLKLEENPFDPSLKTHALSGNFSGRYACSVTHDIRIVFTLTEDTIHLLNIGSHDEIY